jgi:hypothetical protein
MKQQCAVAAIVVAKLLAENDTTTVLTMIENKGTLFNDDNKAFGGFIWQSSCAYRPCSKLPCFAQC